MSRINQNTSSDGKYITNKKKEEIAKNSKPKTRRNLGLTKSILVRLNENDYNDLITFCDEDGVKTSEVIRKGIKQYIAEHKKAEV